jgi:hypothetical protein
MNKGNYSAPQKPFFSQISPIIKDWYRSPTACFAKIAKIDWISICAICGRPSYIFAVNGVNSYNYLKWVQYPMLLYLPQTNIVLTLIVNLKFMFVLIFMIFGQNKTHWITNRYLQLKFIFVPNKQKGC